MPRCAKCGKFHVYGACTSPGWICFQCSDLGHLAINCTAYEKWDKYVINLKMGQYLLKSVCATTLDISVMSAAAYSNITRNNYGTLEEGAPPGSVSFFNTTTDTLGGYTGKFRLEGGESVEIKFYVLPKKTLQYAFFVGRDAMRKLEIIFTNGVARITPKLSVARQEHYLLKSFERQGQQPEEPFGSFTFDCKCNGIGMTAFIGIGIVETILPSNVFNLFNRHAFRWDNQEIEILNRKVLPLHHSMITINCESSALTFEVSVIMVTPNDFKSILNDDKLPPFSIILGQSFLSTVKVRLQRGLVAIKHSPAPTQEDVDSNVQGPHDEDVNHSPAPTQEDVQEPHDQEANLIDFDSTI